MFGYLLEGSFTSLYRNRLIPKGLNVERFQDKGVDSKVIVVADGDMIRNDFNIQSGEPLALGVDPYVRTTYANEEFLMRALSYLTDEDGLTLVRNKDIKIRPLDKVKIGEEKNFWIGLNMALPICLVILFGILKMTIRKRRFGR